MSYAAGDIVLFESAVAGKMKFHLCICVDLENEMHSFIFLNSDGAGFRDQFIIDCNRIPALKASRTGVTAFDCPTVHRKTGVQLAKLRSKVICRLPKDVAEEFLVFASGITSMTGRDHARLVSTLKEIADT